MERIKFTSIDKLSTAYENIKKKTRFAGLDKDMQPFYDNEKALPVMSYRGTVKLHGTCAGVSFQNGNLVFLSKERVVTPESDNEGFANWCFEKDSDVWFSLFSRIMNKLGSDFNKEDEITLFGEWCGQGIQKKAAITQCEKMFFIFAVRVGNYVDNGGKAIGWLPVSFIEDLNNVDENIYNSLMFENYIIELDWNKPKDVQKIVESKTDEINNRCPVSYHFGVDGVGEGVVWVPVDDEFLNNTRFWFKTKGDKHKQNKKRKDTEINPVVLEDVNSVIDEYLVENRLERGIAYFKESGIDMLPENTRIFIDFIVDDIMKDAAEHIERLETDEKTIKKAVTKQTGTWFNKYLEKMQ